MSEKVEYGDISSVLSEYYSKEFLETFQKEVVTQRFGASKKLGQNQTKTITFKTWDNLPVTTAKLSEGVPPESLKPTTSTVSATLQQYGYVMELTDVVNDTHIDPVLKEMIKGVANAMVQTIELVTFNALKAGTNVEYAGGVLTRATLAATIDRVAVRRAVRTLRRNLAKKFTEIVGASAKVSTKGVESAYFAMVHPDMDSDLRDVTGFLPVIEYSSVEKRVAGEIGSIEQVRFVEADGAEPILEGATTNASQSTFLTNGGAGTGSADVYPIYIVGKNAYATVRLQGKGTVNTYVQNPGVSRGGDILGQKGAVGNKLYYTSMILNDDFMVRIESLCTA